MAVRLVLLVVLVCGALAGPQGRVGSLSDPLKAALGGEEEGDLLTPDEPEAPHVADEEPLVPNPPVCPARCVCRYDVSPKLVDCSNRKFTAFPPSEEVPEDVEYLDLSDNDIRTVPRDLPAWEHLEVLNVAGNQLTDFPPRALSSMPALEMLDLSRNRIASLRHVRPDRFISDNPTLQVLNLSSNGIQDLGHGSFQSLSSESLQVLDVSHCAVSSIDGENALAGLPALRVLRVHGNPLQTLPFFIAPALRELDVSDCRLHAVRADVLVSLPGLTHLAVNRNPDLAHFQPPGPATPGPGDQDQLSHLINGTAPWSSALQVLEAEDCSLYDVSFLSTLPNLTEVHLRGNRIATLEPLGLLDNGELRHLDLADNKLENLPAQAFTGTELLRELNLSGNRLSAIHVETFAKHTALLKLNVSRNPMASLQLTAPGLRVLDASHAELQVLVDGVLDGTPELRELNISNNPLPALPDRLASPGSESALHSLDISFCRLSDLSSTVLDGLAALQSVDLRGNRFTGPLKVEAFSENIGLHQIELDDNPWRCDCKSQEYRDFVQFLLDHPAKEDVHSLRCHGPEAVQGETWFDACLGPRGSTLASMSTWMFVVILAVCVAVVAAGVFSVRRLTRGKARRRRQQQQQEEEERRACEQEAARRRLHRRMQQQQQEQLRRQSVRASLVSTDDPDPHPPSYEEAVLMDRMTQEDPVENGHEDSDSEGEDQTFTAELHKTIPRINSSGSRIAEVIEEEEEGASGTESSSGVEAEAASSGANQSNGNAKGNARRLSTKL